MDVVVVVLAKLQKEGSPFICEEEIEDLYSYKMQALVLIKHPHWAWMADEEVRRRQTKQDAERTAKVEAAHEIKKHRLP